MRCRLVTVAVLVLVVLTMTSCAAGPGSPVASGGSSSTTPPVPPVSASSSDLSRSAPTTATSTRRAGAPTLAISGIEPALDPYVTRAREDLAGRLGVPPGEVELVASALVTWPDAALGCPRPGMSYAQVATDGALIELRVTGKVYRYHSGGSTLPFLCQT